jgi:hypothetical protein
MTVPGNPIFSVDWEMAKPWSAAELVIDQVFFDFDGPVSFSVRLGPLTLVLQKSELHAERCLYLGAIVDPAVVEAMKRNEISVPAVMTGGRMLVLGMDGMLVRGYWSVSPATIERRHLPTEGVCLNDFYMVAPDRFELSHGPMGTTVEATGLAPQSLSS